MRRGGLPFRLAVRRRAVAGAIGPAVMRVECPQPIRRARAGARARCGSGRRRRHLRRPPPRPAWSSPRARRRSRTRRGSWSPAAGRRGAAGSSPSATASPVRTKPLASTAARFWSQAALGSAPMNRNRWRSVQVRVAPLAASRKTAAVRPSVRSPSRPDHLLADVQLDVRQGGDAVDQVARHGRLEPAPAHDQVQALDPGGEEHDRLAGRVAAADQRHLLALAELRLDRRGPVGDAGTLEGREIRDVRPAIAGAGGDDHGARPHGAAVGELQAQRIAGAARGAAAVEPRDLQRDGDLGAEFQRLAEGASGQRLAGDAGREAQIVLDPGRRAGLAADRALVEHEHREALGGGVDRGREPGRAGPDHGDVVQGLRDRGRA